MIAFVGASASASDLARAQTPLRENATPPSAVPVDPRAADDRARFVAPESVTPARFRTERESYGMGRDAARLPSADTSAALRVERDRFVPPSRDVRTTMPVQRAVQDRAAFTSPEMERRLAEDVGRRIP